MLEWLETFDQTPGRVVRTIQDGKPVKATRTEDGWDITEDVWA